MLYFFGRGCKLAKIVLYSMSVCFLLLFELQVRLIQRGSSLSTAKKP